MEVTFGRALLKRHRVCSDDATLTLALLGLAGIDDDSNSVLDLAEIDTTAYVCNG